MERILVGVDGSAPSLEAVDFAADLAGKYNAELILLTVTSPLPPQPDPAVEEYARLEHIPAPGPSSLLTTADYALDDARGRARAKGATQISIESSVWRPSPRNRCSSQGPEGRSDRGRQSRTWPARRPPSRKRRAEGHQPRPLPGCRRAVTRLPADLGRQRRSHSPVSSSRRSSSMPLKSNRDTIPTTLPSSTIGKWR